MSFSIISDLNCCFNTVDTCEALALCLFSQQLLYMQKNQKNLKLLAKHIVPVYLCNKCCKSGLKVLSRWAVFSLQFCMIMICILF